MNFPSEVRRDDATSLEEKEALVVMGGLECFFFYNLVTVSLPIHMNNHVSIKFIESPWIVLHINTSWKHLAPGGGGRGALNKLFYREAPPRGPTPCNFICRFDKINQSFSLTRYVEELENSFKIRTCKKKSIPWCKCIPVEILKKSPYLMLMLNLHTLLAQLINRRQTVAAEFFIKTD